jgi:hypothetical protein
MAAPDLRSLKSFLGISEDDTADDAALQESLDAALAAQRQVCLLPSDAFGAAVYTDDLALAVLLRSQRYVARRNSPEGVVGLSVGSGDFVSARVPSLDVDVQTLEGPFRRIPIG